MVSFVLNEEANFADDDYLFIPNIQEILNTDMEQIDAYVIKDDVRKISLRIEPMTEEEKEIIRCGLLINYNRKCKKED